MAAVVMGILDDSHGIPCPACLGSCSVEDKNCPECEGNGTIQPGEEEIIEAQSDRGVVDSVLMIYASSERPMIPTEWLSQPAVYTEAYRFLVNYMFGEFKDRKEALRNAG